MEMTTLSVRETHKYVGTYRHLDRWRTVARVKLLAPIKIRAIVKNAMRAGIRHNRNMYDCNLVDMSDGPTYIHTVVAPRGWTDKDLMIRALENEFSAWGCAHEYDCCGCASYTARAKHIRGREYRVEIEVSYNY